MAGFAMAAGFIAMSVILTFFPKILLDFYSRSRLWRWYLKLIYNVERDQITSKRMIRKVRIQGILTLPGALLLLYGMLMGFPYLK